MDVVPYDPMKHSDCPMFLTRQEAEDFIKEYHQAATPVIVSIYQGFRMWAVVPKPKTCPYPLATLKVLLSGAETVQGLVDMIQGEGHDTWVVSKEMVEIDEDYKWDNSFFEKEKC